MAVTTYTYSVANDTLNGKVELDALTLEISQSSIVIGLNSINVSDDVLDILMNDAISAGEKTTLDGVVAAHEGLDIEPETPHVIVDNTIAIDKGAEDFDTLISHDWTNNTTWPAVSDSCWMFEPSASTKQLKMVKSEVQFSHDVKLGSQTIPGEFYFDIWVYNPLVDLGLPIDADNPTFIPGVSSGNPLRFLYKRTVFTSIKSVFDYGNEHFTMNANVDGLSYGITTVKFNYDQTIILRGDQGAQVRFCTKDNQAMDGSYCTVSVVIREEDIPS